MKVGDSHVRVVPSGAELHRLQAARARNPDRRVRLLQRARPRIDVAHAVVLAAEGERPRSGPRLDDQIVRFVELLARIGRIDGVGVILGPAAHDHAGDQAPAADHVDHGELLGHARRRVVEGKRVADHGDANTRGLPRQDRGDQVGRGHVPVRVRMVLVDHDAVEPQLLRVHQLVEVAVVQAVTLLRIVVGVGARDPGRPLVIVRQVGPGHEMEKEKLHRRVSLCPEAFGRNGARPEEAVGSRASSEEFCDPTAATRAQSTKERRGTAAGGTATGSGGLWTERARSATGTGHAGTRGALGGSSDHAGRRRLPGHLPDRLRVDDRLGRRPLPAVRMDRRVLRPAEDPLHLSVLRLRPPVAGGVDDAPPLLADRRARRPGRRRPVLSRGGRSPLPRLRLQVPAREVGLHEPLLPDRPASLPAVLDAGGARLLPRPAAQGGAAADSPALVRAVAAHTAVHRLLLRRHRQAQPRLAGGRADVHVSRARRPADTRDRVTLPSRPARLRDRLRRDSDRHVRATAARLPAHRSHRLRLRRRLPRLERDLPADRRLLVSHDRRHHDLLLARLAALTSSNASPGGRTLRRRCRRGRIARPGRPSRFSTSTSWGSFCFPSGTCCTPVA